MKALVIDDSPISRRVVKHVLRTHNITSVEAEDGLQALDALKRDDSIGLAMVDISMPKMGGLEFVRAVRSNPKYNNVKLLMVTASNLPENIRTAKELGADDFLTKPVNPQLVASKLRHHGLN